MSESDRALVDGSNVAHSDEGDQPRVRLIRLMCAKLEEEGYEPIAVVVSNDRFRERIDKFPELRQRIIRYMIVEDEVVLERRNGKRP